MTVYGDLARDAVIERLTIARGPDRILDGFVWLHAGCDYPPTRRGFEPWGPANSVNGRTMQKAYSLGLHGVEHAFNVPMLTDDIGAACYLLGMWLPNSFLDIRTGAVRPVHRCEIAVGADVFVGHSRLSGAAAICAALLEATRDVAPLPGTIQPSA